jgi:hypothetical protein
VNPIKKEVRGILIDAHICETSRAMHAAKANEASAKDVE